MFILSAVLLLGFPVSVVYYERLFAWAVLSISLVYLRSAIFLERELYGAL